jgi:hypothetical protein
MENEDHTLSWEEIRALAQDLEITFDDAGEGVEMQKYQGNYGWFQDSEAGRREAQKWLGSQRENMEFMDGVRAQEPKKRKLFGLF